MYTCIPKSHSGCFSKFGVPCGDQIWLAGNPSFSSVFFSLKPLFSSGISQLAMFDDTEGY